MPNGADAMPLALRDEPRGPEAEVIPTGLPFGVIALALLQLALGAWWLVALAGIQVGIQPGMPQNLIAAGQPGQVVVWIFGLARLIAGVGLLARLRMAWVLVMLATGIGLALSIAGYAVGQPDDLRLLVEVISAFYLNQPAVHAIFRGQRWGAAR